MAKTREQKSKMITELTDKIGKAKSVVFTSQRGLTVKDSSDLRNLCKKENVEYVSIKKTLLSIILKDIKMDDVDTSSYDGIVGVVLGYNDEVSPARITNTFAKDHEQLQLNAGILEGMVVGVEKVKQLANLPSKEELLAKLIGSMNSPVRGFVSVLSGTISGFVRVLDQIHKEKSKV